MELARLQYVGNEELKMDYYSIELEQKIRNIAKKLGGNAVVMSSMPIDKIEKFIHAMIDALLEPEKTLATWAAAVRW